MKLLPGTQIKLNDVIQWMLSNLEKDGCLYQEDVVDYLVKNNQMDFLKENTDGNLALKLSVNSGFKKRTEENVVWVIPIRCRCVAVPYTANLFDPDAPSPEEVMKQQVIPS